MRKFITGDEGLLGNPTKFRALNGWLTVVWAIMLPVAVVTGLLQMVLFISVVSIYANFAAHLSTWAASRTEEAQSEDDSVQRQDIGKLQRQIDEIHAAVCKLNGELKK